MAAIPQIPFLLTILTWIFTTTIVTKATPQTTRADLRKAIIAVLSITFCIAWLSGQWALFIYAAFLLAVAELLVLAFAELHLATREGVELDWHSGLH